jgi:hypothetical protein
MLNLVAINSGWHPFRQGNPITLPEVACNVIGMNVTYPATPVSAAFANTIQLINPMIIA